MSLLRDEQDKLSLARTLLMVDSIQAIVMIWVDTFSTMPVPAEGYVLIGAMWPLLAVWAAGPRMAQHLSPVAKAATTAIAAGVAKLGQKLGGHSSGYVRPVGIVLDSHPDWQEDDEL